MKNNIDISGWKKFKIKDIFVVGGTKTTKVDNLEEYGLGEYPYVTTQSQNNGVENFYNYYTENGDCITIDSAVLGTTFYQEKNFSASDHVEKLILKNRKLNKYVALFLTTVINKENFRYAYGRKFSQSRIKETTIKLPSKLNSKNEYEPDWEYMESYTRKLYKKVIQESYTRNTKTSLKFNVEDWRNYRIKDIFNVSNTTPLINIVENGKIPYVTRTSINNGVDNFIQNYDEITRKEYVLNKGNCITIGAEGIYSFYQEDNFISGVKIYTLRNKKLNKINSIFLITILNKELFRYNYGRARVKEKIENEIIKLPSKLNSKNEYEPDWEYMENYIKQLPYGDII